MSNARKIKVDMSINEPFVFHLDVNNAQIMLEQYIAISKTLEITSNSICKLLCGKENCKIVVEPLEIGTLKLVYKLVFAPVALIVAAMIPDTVNGILEEFTGNNWSYYSGKTTRAVVDAVKGAYNTTTENLKKMANKVPEQEREQIDKIIKAQNDFYVELSKDENIKGIGFSGNEDFPIKRRDFTLHTSSDIERKLPTLETIKHLVIYRSLNVDEDGKWEFRDKADGTHISAYIEDEQFKQQFLGGKTPLKKTKKDDELVALVEYDRKMKNGSNVPPVMTIKEIYRFNNKELKKVPDNLVENVLKKKETSQGDLFDD